MQYQFRDYFGGQFCSILVRFTCPNLPSGCYCEFKELNYYNIYDLLSDAFSEETIDKIDRQIARKREQEHNMINSKQETVIKCTDNSNMSEQEFKEITTALIAFYAGQLEIASANNTFCGFGGDAIDHLYEYRDAANQFVYHYHNLTNGKVDTETWREDIYEYVNHRYGGDGNEDSSNS